jgi:hypothetical protein
MKRETEIRYMRDPLLNYAMRRGAQLGMTEAETFEWMINLMLEQREQWMNDRVHHLMNSMAQPLVIPSNATGERPETRSEDA